MFLKYWFHSSYVCNSRSATLSSTIDFLQFPFHISLSIIVDCILRVFNCKFQKRTIANLRTQFSFSQSDCRLRIAHPPSHFSKYGILHFFSCNFSSIIQLSVSLTTLQIHIAELILYHSSLWILLYLLIWDQVWIFTLYLQIHYFPYAFLFHNSSIVIDFANSHFVNLGCYR